MVLLVRILNECYLLFLLIYSLLADKKLKPLSVDEERFMRAFYEAKVQEVCSAFEFPHKIQVHLLFFQMKAHYDEVKNKTSWILFFFPSNIFAGNSTPIL